MEVSNKQELDKSAIMLPEKKVFPNQEFLDLNTVILKLKSTGAKMNFCV